MGMTSQNSASDGPTVLVCGGRDYADQGRVNAALAMLRPGKIVHGAARGADTLAGRYAAAHGIPCVAYPADWEKYGRSAGYVRNRKMLDCEEVDVVVAFPGGRGTANMVGLAEKAGKIVLDFRNV